MSAFDDRGLPHGYPFRAEFEIEPMRARELLNAGCVLLDVRTEEEVRTARIEPSLHVPLAELPERVVELPEDAAIVTLCHHGVRSLKAAQLLREQGFTARSLAGGIDLWSQSVDPSVPRYVREGGRCVPLR